MPEVGEGQEGWDGMGWDGGEKGGGYDSFVGLLLHQSGDPLASPEEQDYCCNNRNMIFFIKQKQKNKNKQKQKNR